MSQSSSIQVDSNLFFVLLSRVRRKRGREHDSIVIGGSHKSSGEGRGRKQVCVSTTHRPPTRFRKLSIDRIRPNPRTDPRWTRFDASQRQHNELVKPERDSIMRANIDAIFPSSRRPRFEMLSNRPRNEGEKDTRRHLGKLRGPISTFNGSHSEREIIAFNHHRSFAIPLPPDIFSSLSSFLVPSLVTP